MPNHLRLRLFAVVGYFIIPKDLYPEDVHGPIGYIDDLMLCLHVLRDVRDYYGIDIIVNSWNEKSETEVSYYLDSKFEELTKEYCQLYDEIQDYLGFR